MTLSDWLAVAGLVLALPLGIAGSLLADPLKDWWSRRSQESRAQQLAAHEHEMVGIRHFAANRAELHEYLLSLVLRAAWVTAVFGALSGILFSLGNLSALSQPVGGPIDPATLQNYQTLAKLGAISATTGQIVAIVGAFIVVLITQRGFRVVRLVRGVDAVAAEPVV
jgi:hypothetical protein